MNSHVAPLEAQLKRTDLQKKSEHGKELADPRRSVEDNQFCREVLEKLRGHFSDQKETLDVLESWEENMTPAEIKEMLDLSQNQLETIQRRITRAIAVIIQEVNE